MILLQAAPSSTITSLIMFAMIFAVMYLFMIRPQVNKQKKEREYRLKLKKGDEIVTIGGIYGKIKDVKKDSFVIEVHGGTNLKIAKTAVSLTGEALIEEK